MDGADGDTGPAGPPGARGAKGFPGLQGEPGTRFFVQSDEPANGADGDLWLDTDGDTDGMCELSKRVSGSWTVVLKIGCAASN